MTWSRGNRILRLLCIRLWSLLGLGMSEGGRRRRGWAIAGGSSVGGTAQPWGGREKRP
uniref:Uncharacterized protein n=1 Tax=Arundo donax TaxID=35708 RepID=A0A0A9GIQ3_ARUDO